MKKTLKNKLKQGWFIDFFIFDQVKKQCEVVSFSKWSDGYQMKYFEEGFLKLKLTNENKVKIFENLEKIIENTFFNKEVFTLDRFKENKEAKSISIDFIK